MTPDRFDEIARLWAAAPSRRVFVQQVGAVFLVGAFGRSGIRLPRWLPPRQHPQCYAERDGMQCGDCGTCQRGQCIPESIDPCHAWGIGLFGGMKSCARCDAKTQACVACEERQKCCNDGCCNGNCSANGSCCPEDQQCGEECCRGCAKCNKATMKCEKPEPAPKSCPKNYVLVDDCCVCLPGLCGGICCREKDQTCLGGKCCNRCGLDGAVCCDDRVCCRERCIDPGERCCPCWEDVSAEEGDRIAEEARKNVQWVKEHKLVYGNDRKRMNTSAKGPGQIDCTLFTARSLGDLNQKGHDLSSRNLDGNCNFRRLKSGEPPRAGDVMAQSRSSGPPGSQHVGISSGSAGRGAGTYIGIAMGNSGARTDSIWGPEEKGGWFEGGDDLRVYRPQKRNRNCTDR